METKHTQREWHNNGLEIRSQSGMILANIYKHLPSNQSLEEAEANARLMASAPELLEALNELKEKYLFNQTKAQAKNNHIDETLIKVESAIEKATNK